MKYKCVLLLFYTIIMLGTVVESIKICTDTPDISQRKEKTLFTIKQQQPRRNTRNAFYHKQHSNETHAIRSTEKQTFNDSSKISLTRPKIRFSQSQHMKIPFRAKNYRCNDTIKEECKLNTEQFRDKIINEMKKIMSEKVDNDENLYNVDYKLKNDVRAKTILERFCSLIKANVRELRKDNVNDLELRQAMPLRIILKRKKLNPSCTVVSSAGSMLDSKLGEFIDNHDVVLRFNNAPTLGYEADVGKKTTIRIVNSQVVSKPEFNFTTSSLYKNISIGIWDPGKYNMSIEDWILEPDFNLFENYKKIMVNKPDTEAFLIDPRSIWRLWQALQDNSNVDIPRNPPSSGFIGIALLLPICSYINVIEYIPSTRFNGKCHYYTNEMNSACTFGVWHPLAAEKLLMWKLNSSDDFTTFQKGLVRLEPKQDCK